MDQWEIVAAEAGERLDKFIAARRPDLSRAQVQRLLADGFITVNGVAVKASYRVKAGDHLQVRLPPPAPSDVQPEPIPLRIVYEDGDLLVVDKPAGMVVHPAPGHAAGTLVAAVLAHAPDLAGIGGARRPGIVHRLDKDTSGLILIAKNDLAHRHLQAQFKSRSVRKVYLALVEGYPAAARGRVEAPIGRDPHRRQRMAVVPNGREAVTEYRVLSRYPGYTLVAAEPKTGRTHQIRVHFAWLGHPVVGDRVYGHRASALICPRQFLHAHRLGFRLPASGAYVEFESPLPPDLTAVLARLSS
jgi:23S rRNA pseudouridine1911/1915/1917 synthase